MVWFKFDKCNMNIYRKNQIGEQYMVQMYNNKKL